MNTKLARNRRLVLGFASALAMVLIIALLTVTPQGRAFAQEIIHFFTQARSDTIPASTAEPLTWVTVTPGAPVATPTPKVAFAAECGDFNSPKCTMEQIRARVDFPLLELGTIPDGMHFVGATGGPDGITVMYDDGTYTYGVAIWEQPLDSNVPLQLPEVGLSAVVESVQVGDVIGEYVKGTYTISMPQMDPFTTPAPGSINQVWDANAGVQTLIWADNGAIYGLMAYGSAGMLDKAALVALANGMTTESVAVSASPMPSTPTPAVDVTLFDGNPYDLSVADAGAQAGFDVLEPTILPQIFFLQGATYQPEGNIVCIFYLEPTPMTMPRLFGLRLSEQVISASGNCTLCGITVGDYQQSLDAKNGLVVGRNAVIETIKVAGFDGQYVEGMWGNMGGWSWLPYPEIMTLRWQANGKAYELYYSGFTMNGIIPITKADFLTIAESIMK